MKRIIAFCFVITFILSLIACGIKDQETTIASDPYEIEIQQYLVFEEKGFDKYGELNVSLNNDALLADLISHFKENIELTNKESAVEYLISYLNQNPIIEFQYNSNEHYNGETVTIEISSTDAITELKKYFYVDFIVQSTTYVMSNLTPIKEYNPFEDLVSDVSGFNGKGQASFSIKHESEDMSWSFKINSDKPLENLSNGDVLHLTLGEGTISVENFEKEFGYHISSDSMDYTITELISDPTPDNVFDCIDKESLDIFDAVIYDWVEDGLNDENQGNKKRKTELFGKIFMTNNEKNKLFLIYHVTDNFVENGYYVYISPSVKILVNPVTKELLNENGEKLTKSFVYYDKETIRYTQKFKWGQNYEKHGFMYKNVPYAGKLTIEEEISYLIEMYPEFTNVYYSTELNDIVSPENINN